MSQSTRLFRRCLQWLGLGSQKSQEFRRRSPRFGCALEGSYGLTASVEGESWPATVRNISLDGVGMVVSRAFEPGIRLRVTLHNASKSVSRTLIIRVVYTLEHPSGDWILGGAFTRALTGAELQALLS